MPEYPCKRTESYVMAERAGNITGMIIVGCQYYTNFGQNRFPCTKDSPRFKKCLVKNLVLAEEKKRKSD